MFTINARTHLSSQLNSNFPKWLYIYIAKITDNISVNADSPKIISQITVSLAYYNQQLLPNVRKCLSSYKFEYMSDAFTE